MQVPNFNYEITHAYGVISDNTKQSKELNAISYNGFPAKMDLRIWIKDPDAPNGKKMGKGLTLNEEEIYTLKEILNGIDLDDPIPQGKRATALKP